MKLSQFLFQFSVLAFILVLGFLPPMCAVSLARAGTPAPAQDQTAEQVQGLLENFRWLKDVQVLLVSDPAVNSLRGRLGVADLEAKVRADDSNLKVTQAYITKLTSDVQVLQLKVQALVNQLPKPAPSPSASPSPVPSATPSPSASPSPGE